MLNIKVTYLPPFKEVTQIKEESIMIQGNTIGSLVNALIKKYGNAFQNILFTPDGKTSIGIMIWVNGHYSLELPKQLKDGDKVVFGMVVAGG